MEFKGVKVAPEIIFAQITNPMEISQNLPSETHITPINSGNGSAIGIEYYIIPNAPKHDKKH
jgi:hypothetical protein